MSRTLIKVMKKFSAISILILALSSSVSAQSLWDDNANWYGDK